MNICNPYWSFKRLLLSMDFPWVDIYSWSIFYGPFKNLFHCVRAIVDWWQKLYCSNSILSTNCGGLRICGRPPRRCCFIHSLNHIQRVKTIFVINIFPHKNIKMRFCTLWTSFGRISIKLKFRFDELRSENVQMHRNIDIRILAIE